MKFLVRLTVLVLLTNTSTFAAPVDDPLPLLRCKDIGTNVGGNYWATFCLSNMTCNAGLCRKDDSKDTLPDKENECSCQ